MKRELFRCVSGLCGALLFCAVLVAQVEQKQPEDPAKNEYGSVGSLRSLNTAEAVYSSTYPQIGFTCSLADFNAPADGQKPSSKASDLIDRSLTNGTKRGYIFTLTCPSHSTPQRTYQLTAVPVSPGKSGTRAFCTDQTAVIRASADGQAATCLASGKPI